MTPDALLITSDTVLANRVKALFEGPLALSFAWVGHDWLLWDLLIVDVSDLSPADWMHVAAWSRRPGRPPLVLIDDGRVPRERLASVLADALIPSDATDAELRGRLEDVSAAPATDQDL